jgi:hypothetical protein
MKKNLSLTAFLTVLTLVSCQKSIQQSPDPSNQISTMSAAKSPSAGNTTVNLSVLVDDGASNQILSDGKGAYINGTDQVGAQILSSDGNFYMNTNSNTAQAPVRTMSFLPGPLGTTLEGKRNYSLRTNATIMLQNMAVASSQEVGFRAWGVQQHGVVDWRLLFRNGLEASSTSLTDSALVTRISTTVWTVEPANCIGITYANARLIDGYNNNIGSGYYQVPFKLTLNKIN